jgi:hypothetical protein
MKVMSSQIRNKMDDFIKKQIKECESNINGLEDSKIPGPKKIF